MKKKDLLTLIPNRELDKFYKGIEKFCHDHLSHDSEEEEIISNSKTFADPVAGYISISPWEVAIIDSPLFQRLRGVKQLGFAFLVYPTLGYSRFEHTLGVLARQKQVFDNLKENLQEQQSKEILTHLEDHYTTVTIRLAVLCHDLGHTIFSHVSEAAINNLKGDSDNNYPSVKTISSHFKEFAGRNIPIAEIFSSCIVYSNPFVSFLKRIGLPEASTYSKAEKLAKNAAHLILGLPFPDDSNSLYLAQLMSCGIDIDKLDYMLRESHLSGITLGVSLEWLLKKLTINKLPASQIPNGISSRIKQFHNDSHFNVLSLKKGGQFAFEEFCIARLALHEKIYLHQKIRAAEAQVKKRLIEFPMNVTFFQEAHRWLYLKESMLDYPELNLPSLPEANLFNQTIPRNTAQLCIKPISERKLLHRAFAFGWLNAIAEPVLENQGEKDFGTDKLMQLIQERPHKFLNCIEEFYNEIKQKLSKIDDFPRNDPEIIIDPPRLSSLQQGHDTIHIEHPNRLSIRWTMPIDRIVEYYHRNRAIAYVFATWPHLPYVLLATEKAVWKMFNVIYIQESFVNKQISNRAKEAKAKLHEIGYYSDTLPLQPVSEYLISVHAQNLVANIAQKLALYESRTKKRVTPASITTFVSQFPLDLQEVTLQWLQFLEWVQPENLLTNAIDRVFEKNLFQVSNTIGICPLGAMSDSASRIGYYLRELGDKYHTEKKISILPINEALGQKLDSYIIFDDNVNSGMQALNIFASWFEIQLDPNLRLEEEHVQCLPEDLRKELLAKPVALTFAIGTEGACTNLLDQLLNLFSFSSEKLFCNVGKKLMIADRIFSGPNSPFQHSQKLKLKNFITETVKEILLNEKKSEEKAKEKALGYKSTEAMVVFPYNCPTMTVTALWISGKVKGKTWIPLIERGRRKSPSTGLPIGEDS